MKETPFDRLKKIVSDLRNPETGCPWDLEQNHNTLKKYLIEETYEAIEAIDQGDDKELCSELGDVLLQVMLHSQIASERGAFTIEDVLDGVSDKMVRRHPHVFGDTKCATSEEVKANWEKIKQSERKDSSSTASLKSVPKYLPSLLRASRLGEKAAKVGFDWENGKDAWQKCLEEIDELREVVEQRAQAEDVSLREKENLEAKFQEELGDLLFSLSQLARHSGVSPEQVLRDSCDKFMNRFETMEKTLESFQGKSAEDLERAWNQAKELLQSQTG